MIEYSAFDSTHYDLRIGRLNIDAPDQLAPAMRAARDESFDMVVVRVPADETWRAAIPGEPLETLVTSELGNASVSAGGSVAIEEHRDLEAVDDIEAVATLTAAAIGGSHLHNDPRLPIERTRRLYAAWARNDVTGRAQRTFLAREGGTVVGYITVLERGDRSIIDLFAVAPSVQGRGIGSALLATFVHWTRARHLHGQVGTQSDNPALALYQRSGFVPAERQYTYHLWL